MIRRSKFYIVGEKNFVNELLNYVLSAEFDNGSDLLEDFSRLPYSNYSTKPDILLIDAKSNDLRELLLNLSIDRGSITNSYATCLYNLDHDTGVEARALKFGIRGFFYVDEQLLLLKKGLKAVIDGEVWISRELLLKAAISGDASSEPANQKGAGTLTRRETEILMNVCVGKSNEEIADQLFISTYTVKTHLYNIFRKIDVPNRLQAALWATKNL